MVGKRKARQLRQVDPVTAYARAVKTGKIVAGPYVRLAAARHLRDVREQKKRGLQWRPSRAQEVIDFFREVLVLEDGSPFVLLPWQQFVVGSCFGWYLASGFRRFRTAYVETGKGSGKTPLAAGIGLYGLVADGEPAAEVYSAATERDQAKIVWKDAWRMVKANPDLSALIEAPDNAEVQLGIMTIPKEAAVFRPVSSEHKGLDGKRVHIALIDELHEHPHAIVVDKMRAGTKRRQNALIFEITNSGFDRTSVCYQHHELSVKLLEGTVTNEGWFAFVCGLDKDDDWRDPAVWPKANPSLGTVLPLSYLEEQVKDAITMPSKENIVKRLNFCVWTEQSERWLTMTAWDACPSVPLRAQDFAGQCWMGLDMASTNDFASSCRLFGPDEDGIRSALWRFWLPEASLDESTSTRPEAVRLQLRDWARQDVLTLTPGNVVDYDLIEEQILKDAAECDLQEIAFDRWNVTQLVTHLKDALGEDRLVEYPQTMAAMSAPSKELEKLVASGKLRHGGNPVARWMASNVTIKHGPNQQIKPERERSGDKIDGIIALIMALSRSMAAPQAVAPQDYTVEWVG